MPTFGWTWRSGSLPETSEIVVAFFSALPRRGFQLARAQAFQLEFTRGSIWNYYLKLAGADYSQFATTLMIRFRPTPDGSLDWSFEYNVQSLPLFDQQSLARLKADLRTEVDNFILYFNSFAARGAPGQTMTQRRREPPENKGPSGGTRALLRAPPNHAAEDEDGPGDESSEAITGADVQRGETGSPGRNRYDEDDHSPADLYDGPDVWADGDAIRVRAFCKLCPSGVVVFCLPRSVDPAEQAEIMSDSGATCAACKCYFHAENLLSGYPAVSD